MGPIKIGLDALKATLTDPAQFDCVQWRKVYATAPPQRVAACVKVLREVQG